MNKKARQKEADRGVAAKHETLFRPLLWGAIMAGGAFVAARWLDTRHQNTGARLSLPDQMPHRQDSRVDAYSSVSEIAHTGGEPVMSVSEPTQPPVPAAQEPAVESQLSTRIDPIHDMPSPVVNEADAANATPMPLDGREGERASQQETAGQRANNATRSYNTADAVNAPTAQSESKMGHGEELRDREFPVPEAETRLSAEKASKHETMNPGKNRRGGRRKDGDVQNVGDVLTVFDQDAATPDLAQETR